jgi:hypothetical protein
MTTTEIVNTLREAGQDFEWYPTTDRMIAAITADLYGEDSYKAPGSILDIGAGDGRVLTALANKAEHAKLFAIEKSAILQQQQPDRIVPVGCDFHEQNLMTLPVDVLFSNPPYSEYEEWAERIIRTAYARTVYLILPQRWEQSAGIAAALEPLYLEHGLAVYEGNEDSEWEVDVKVERLTVNPPIPSTYRNLVRRRAGKAEQRRARRKADLAQSPMDGAL